MSLGYQTFFLVERCKRDDACKILQQEKEGTAVTEQPETNTEINPENDKDKKEESEETAEETLV